MSNPFGAGGNRGFGGILGSRIRQATEKALKPQRAEKPLKPRRGPDPLEPMTVGLLALGKKAAEGLAQHFKDEEHPFEACMMELADQYPDEETRKQVCGAVVREIRDMGEHPTQEASKAETRASSSSHGYEKALESVRQNARRGVM